MSANFAVTFDTRFDLQLVPYKVMTSVHDAMKSNYVGLSENIAGLIENILSLKVCMQFIASILTPFYLSKIVIVIEQIITKTHYS